MMNRKNQLRAITTEIDPDTLLELDKAAASRNISRSQLLRLYISEGLAVKSYEDSYDKLTKIIRQEMNSVLNIDDVRTINNNNTERMIKVMIKLAKPLVANYLLHICYLSEIAPPESMVERITQSVNLSMEYMSGKDNDFLSDTDRLIKLASQM